MFRRYGRSLLCYFNNFESPNTIADGWFFFFSLAQPHGWQAVCTLSLLHPSHAHSSRALACRPPCPGVRDADCSAAGSPRAHTLSAISRHVHRQSALLFPRWEGSFTETCGATGRLSHAPSPDTTTLFSAVGCWCSPFHKRPWWRGTGARPLGCHQKWRGTNSPI
jgi:hypothetical protein